MKQLNISKKTLSYLRAITGFVLVLLIVLFSFAPIVSVNVDNEPVNEAIDVLLGQLIDSDIVDADDLDLHIPENVDISLFTAIRGDILLVKTISLVISAYKVSSSSVTVEEQKRVEEKLEDFLEMLKNPRNQEAFIALSLFFAQSASADDAADDIVSNPKDDDINDDKVNTDPTEGIIDDYDGSDETLSDEELNFLIGMLGSGAYGYQGDLDDDYDWMGDSSDDEVKEDDKESSSTSSIVFTVIRVGVLIAILILIHILAIAALISGITSTILLISNYRSLERIGDKFFNTANNLFVLVICIPVLLSLFANISMGWGLVGIIAIGIINIIFAAVLTRLSAYAPYDFKYLNILQICCLAASIGMAIIYFNTIDLGFTRSFINSLESYLIELDYETTMIKMVERYFTPSYSFIADIVIAFISTIMIISIGRIAPMIWRLVALKGRAEKASSELISCGTTTIFGFLLPFVLTFLKNKKHYDLALDGIHEEATEAIYTMPYDVKSKLFAMIFGAIIVLASGIVLSILFRKLCPEMTTEKAAILLEYGSSNIDIKAEAPTAPLQGEAKVNDTPKVAPVSPVIQEPQASHTETAEPTHEAREYVNPTMKLLVEKYRDRILQLERENSMLREENNILKDSLELFSKDSDQQ